MSISIDVSGKRVFNIKHCCNLYMQVYKLEIEGDPPPVFYANSDQIDQIRKCANFPQLKYSGRAIDVYSGQ